MATPTTFTTLGAIHDLPSNDDILDRLKALARNILPQGWRDWTLINSINLDFSVDSTVLNKLQFALPADGIARAFDPAATGLKEHPYKDMKIKMLSWAFCRGLVYSPSSLSKQIRGSSASHESFMCATSSIRSSLLSRKSTDRLLAGSASGVPSRRDSSASDTMSRLESLDSRLAAQDARTERVENALERILSELQGTRNKVQLDQDSFPGSPSASGVSSDAEEWEPPSLFAESEVEDVSVEPDFSFAFGPSTKEMEPAIPPPAPEIEALGIECQRLNSSGWSKIPFAEAQKEIQASGVFGRLKVNPEIERRPSAKDDILAKMDGTLGCITHGLLLQRKYLEESMKEVFAKFPAAAPALREHLSAKDSPFRKTTDSLLQFVCGKRSDTILQRRKEVEAATRVHPRLLKDIPPSEGFLFDSKLLTEALKNHASSSRVQRVASGSRSGLRIPAAASRAAPSSASRKRPAQWTAPPHQPVKKRAFQTNPPKRGQPKSSDRPQRKY